MKEINEKQQRCALCCAKVDDALPIQHVDQIEFNKTFAKIVSRLIHVSSNLHQVEPTYQHQIFEYDRKSTH